MFTHGIKSNSRLPMEPQSSMISQETPADQAEEWITPVLCTYELRRIRIEKLLIFIEKITI
jgi:hypothetical protein